MRSTKNILLKKNQQTNTKFRSYFLSIKVDEIELNKNHSETIHLERIFLGSSL